MPVRKIPRSYRNLTGRVAVEGQQHSAAFESPLERDLYVLLDFNPLVESFEPQPVRIEYRRPDGRDSHYTPDTLIRYTDDSGRKPVLCEVKPRKELTERWRELRPGFKAAVRLCRQEGWVFHIYTEKEIRTPFLENARFLRGYRRIATDDLKSSRVRRFLNSREHTTIGDILRALCPVISERGPWLSVLWHLVSTGELYADLGVPLDYRSGVSLGTRGGDLER